MAKENVNYRWQIKWEMTTFTVKKKWAMHLTNFLHMFFYSQWMSMFVFLHCSAFYFYFKVVLIFFDKYTHIHWSFVQFNPLLFFPISSEFVSFVFNWFDLYNPFCSPFYHNTLSTQYKNRCCFDCFFFAVILALNQKNAIKKINIIYF